MTAEGVRGMSTLNGIPALVDPQQARDVGYAEGSALRAKGAKPRLLDGSRDAYYETPHRRERRMSAYYPAWRLGFDAGYLGEPKPWQR
jgi:hypothetical protein